MRSYQEKSDIEILESLSAYTCIRLLIKDLRSEKLTLKKLNSHESRIVSELDKFRPEEKETYLLNLIKKLKRELS